MTDIVSILGTAAATINLYEFFSKVALENRFRRRLALAFALKQPADLRAALGDQIDALWPYYERMGYFPVDVLRHRRRGQPVGMPGPALSKPLKPLHHPLKNSLLPTRPVPIRGKVVRLLNRKPEAILDDIRPVKKPADVLAPTDRGRSQVVFLHKDEPHVGSTQSSVLEDLLNVAHLSKPIQIFQYDPELRERKLLQFRARRFSIFGFEDYTVVLTRRYLRLKFRSRRKFVEIPREQIFWLRLNERSPALTVSTLFEDFRICARKSDLRDIRDLLLGM